MQGPEIPVIEVVSEQGRRTEIVLWPVSDADQDLYIGIRQSAAATFMYPLNRLLVLHINGNGAITHAHPDTGKAIISFDAQTVRQIVAALANTQRHKVML